MALFDTSKAKDRILEALSFIYLFAFSSLYIQLPGLYGDNGVLPIRLLPLSIPSDIVDFLKEPNLIRISPFLNLDSYFMLELCVATGCLVAFSASISNYFRNAFVFMLLWLVYYSCLKIGQVFLWFQWDIMLIEFGFIAILLSKPFVFSKPNSASDKLALWLIRWLLFRLMFSAGVVKLTSGCTSWWGLSALHWHYQSQCIPTPAAWYFHHFPGWFHSLCVAITLIIEILLPFLFFVPLRKVRLFSFYGQVLLQLLIILTGNYNFFNLLTIVLCYSLLKDEDFRPKLLRDKGHWSCVESVLSWFLIGTVVGFGAYLFQLRIAPDFTVKSSIGFTKKQFNWFLNEAINYSIVFSVVLYLIEFILSLLCALRTPKAYRKLTELAGVVFVAVVGLTLLISSFVPFASLHSESTNKLPIAVTRVHRQLKPYYLTNSYGLFRRMTGVGGRPEVILTAAPTETGPWTEYHFRFKPGRLNRVPPLVAPHQPRLDWQMWFAALGSAGNHPWFYNLVYRLLQEEPDVLTLLDTSSLPRNPKYIRAQTYTYHYTSLNDESGNWWRRVPKLEYLPPVSLNSPSLLAAVEAHGLIGKRRQQRDPTRLSLWLTWLRSTIGQPPDLSPLLIVCLMVLITKFALRRASATARLRLTTE